MELVKNIFFNTDKLTQNSTVKLSYTGKFFQDDCEEVYIHYGFGLSWDDLNEIKMEKTDLGFQAEIELGDKETFNFCFKNELNEWDNNSGTNYIFELEKVPENLINTPEIEEALNTPNDQTRFYKLTQKVKMAIYKIITAIPKLISGNYKGKSLSEQ